MSEKLTLEILRNNIVEVNFTKANGDKRSVICTLMNDELPAIAGDVEVLSDAYQSVWEVNEESWKRIRYDSVNTWNIIKDD